MVVLKRNDIKPKEIPMSDDIAAKAENITIKEPTVQTIEQRLAIIESYINSADPYIRMAAEIPAVKKQLEIFDNDITRISGVQARANNYIDGKFEQIEQTFANVITIVKKHDDDYKELMSDIDITDDNDPVTPDDDTETK